MNLGTYPQTHVEPEKDASNLQNSILVADPLLRALAATLRRFDLG